MTVRDLRKLLESFDDRLRVLVLASETDAHGETVDVFAEVVAGAVEQDEDGDPPVLVLHAETDLRPKAHLRLVQ